jgi:hypothetical protein
MTTPAGKNRIMIYGPKSDGIYVIEFRMAAGESLAISIPGTEAAVIRHFQERMPYGTGYRFRLPGRPRWALSLEEPLGPPGRWISAGWWCAPSPL